MSSANVFLCWALRTVKDPCLEAYVAYLPSKFDRIHNDCSCAFQTDEAIGDDPSGDEQKEASELTMGLVSILLMVDVCDGVDAIVPKSCVNSPLPYAILNRIAEIFTKRFSLCGGRKVFATPPPLKCSLLVELVKCNPHSDTLVVNEKVEILPP